MRFPLLPHEGQINLDWVVVSTGIAFFSQNQVAQQVAFLYYAPCT
jgi:hypothetical protein